MTNSNISLYFKLRIHLLLWNKYPNRNVPYLGISFVYFTYILHECILRKLYHFKFGGKELISNGFNGFHQPKAMWIH